MSAFDDYIAAVDKVIANPSTILDPAVYKALVESINANTANADSIVANQPTPTTTPTTTTTSTSTSTTSQAADALAAANALTAEQAAATPAATGFCQDEVRISTHVCNSLHPAVSFDPNGRRGVFWHDNRDGTWEIYGKVLPSQMGARAVEEANNLSLSSGRPVNSECSGFSAADGGPTSPSGIVELTYRCSSDENANASTGQPTDVVARLAQGLLEVNASAQTAILSTEANVDFYKLDVKAGTMIRIDTGANSGQQFTVKSVLASNVLDLGYKTLAQSDSNFVFSILASNDQCEAMDCEFRLTCDDETSMYPDVVADNKGRFHVVWQSKSQDATKKWQLWYSQVYPKNIGPVPGCKNRRFHAQGGFSPVPPTSADATRVIVNGVSVSYASTGDIGDYFSYGDPKMPVPAGQPTGDLLTRTGTHTLYLDTGALGNLDVNLYDTTTAVTETPPTPPPPPPPPPVVTTGTGLKGEYYRGVAFSGTPVTRVDPTVNFNWGQTASPVGGVFSARWTGQVKAEHTEPYTFYLITDDGGRLWVNGVKLVDMWFKHGPIERSGTVAMTAGQKYDIQIEYYENGRGRAQTFLSWSSPSTPKAIIPQANLYDGATQETPAPYVPGVPAPVDPTTTTTTTTINATTTTISSTTGLWTGLAKAGDRTAWTAQSAALGTVTSPPYVAEVANAVANPGDFGQRYAYKNVGPMFMSPPDKAVRMRRLMLPVFPKYAPMSFPEPVPDEQKLVPAPRRPLPPTYIDPVDISRVVQQSQVKYEEGPTRFTLEGDSTGTIYTNVFVNDPAGEWLRLVFQKQSIDGEYKFILGRLACSDDPCALMVSNTSASTNSSRTYDFTLTIWRGPDYRSDPNQVTSARANATKIYEKTYSFEPGENISIYTFPKDKLTLAAGHMYFATLTPPPNFVIAYQGSAPGNVMWSTTDEGVFDQYYVPWTLPPFKGMFAPVFYDGYLGSIGEGTGGGSGSSINQFTMNSMFTIGNSVQMEYSPTFSKIVLGTAAAAPGGLRGSDTSAYSIPGYISAGGAAAARSYGKFWYGGPDISGRGNGVFIQSFPWYPPTGRHIYVTDDLSEIQKFNEFFAKLATYEEPPVGSCCWIPIAKAPKTTQPGHPEWSAIFVIKNATGYPWNVVSAGYVAAESTRSLLETLDSVTAQTGVGIGNKTEITDLSGFVQRAIPFCTIAESNAGFIEGDMYVAGHIAGQLIKVSADGKTITGPGTGQGWVKLPDLGAITGIDQLGAGDLYAVTSTGNFYRITSAGKATKLERAPEALSNVIVLPNDQRFGPLAKKVLASSSSGMLYAFDPETGAMTSYNIGVAITGFDIVKEGMPLYAIDHASQTMFVADKSIFANSVGDLVGVSKSGTIWAIQWSDDGAKATAVGSMQSNAAVNATDILFAPTVRTVSGTDPNATEIVCDSQYNATIPFQLTVDGDNVHPRMEIDDFNNIWLTWHSNRTGSDEVYVARYDGDCGSWSVPTMGGAETRVTNHGKAGAAGRFPNVTIDSGGEAHLAWQSNETSDLKFDIFYTHSTGGGSRFLPQVRVTNSPGEAMMPDLSFSYVGQAERITVVWHDNQFGDFEIMSASKTGGTWRSSAQRGGDLRLTSASGDSLFPRIVTDKNQNLRVVYHDGRLGENLAAIFMSSYVASTGEWYSSGQGGKDMLISHSPQNSFFPDIDTDPAGGLGPVWHDDRHALENPDYHEEVYGLYCLRQGEAVGAPHFQALEIDTYTQHDVHFEIHDCLTDTQIQYTNVPDVCMKMKAPGAMFYRSYNEDGILSSWKPFKSGYDLDTMIAPWQLTCGNGKKTVCIQIQDESSVSYPICQDVILIAPESKFDIEFFKDEALTIPLPSYNGWPITTSGDVYIRITTDEPQIYAPTFDVIERGSHCVFNQETIPIGGSSGVSTGGAETGAASTTGSTTGSLVQGNGVTGFEADSYRSFKGRFKVYRSDGIFHVDGLARVIVHGGNPCNANKSATESGGNNTPPTA